eukprot:CAMPEP_0181191644 /NCGR_PEP_ID=MMETSP1096-20121128/12846_1 /TAXON_ID=156174 ORGANISM="Chrysochromulina ericina, Strain CCMP281" /NCGR_SAMPLE_ID=MMETSP1096 /ASSEMBLY_ACC=CAM_ASM_000453 /LENGTH=535 /DNA_ID=CAMNT_0023280959 /DNA_START=84 /DNA_END=1692 /DNA_ORIENTATION=+
MLVSVSLPAWSSSAQGASQQGLTIRARRGCKRFLATGGPPLSVPPFLPEDLSRSFPPDQPRWPRLERFMLALLTRNGSDDSPPPLQIAVIGGSLTSGESCIEPGRPLSPRMIKERLCAWPERVGEWLQQAFRTRVVVHNIAKMAWSVNEWAVDGIEQRPELLGADLVITELAINDASLNQQRVSDASAVLFLALTSLPRKPAVLALELAVGAFGKASVSEKALRKECGHGHRRTVNISSDFVLTSQAESAQIISADGSYRVCEVWWWPPTWRGPTLKALRIPAVSFRDVVWPDRLSPLPGFREVWHGDRHVTNVTHQAIANVVAFALDSVVKQLCASGSIPAPEVSFIPADDVKTAAAQVRRCSRPLTKLEPPQDSFRSADGNGWGFGEDIKGNQKPGWLASVTGYFPKQRTDVWTSFKVLIGDQRRVILKRLQSFDPTMGRATVTLTPWREPEPEPNDAIAGRRCVACGCHQANVSAHHPILHAWGLEGHWLKPYSTVESEAHDLPAEVMPGNYSFASRSGHPFGEVALATSRA